jgi:tetratricopeptide (TPR) repeat protein
LASGERATGISRGSRRRPAGAAALAALVALGLTLIPRGPALAEDAEASSLFAEGNSAYKAGDFARAVGTYEALLRQGFEGEALLYNLGNAYFKSGDLGRAIASYERALLLAPRDPDLASNLALAREQCADRSAAAGFSARALLGRTVRWLTADEWTIVLEVSYILLLACLLAPLYVPLRRSLASRLRALTGLLLAAATVALLTLTLEYGPGRRGVVIAPEITIRSGPATGYLGEFSLHPGSVVRIEGRREGWVKIVFPPTLRGWTEAAGLEIL